jgi:hypothetical protein
MTRHLLPSRWFLQRHIMIAAGVLLVTGFNMFYSNQTSHLLTAWSYDDSTLPSRCGSSVVPAGIAATAASSAISDSAIIHQHTSYRLYRNETYMELFTGDYHCTGEREALDGELQRTLVFRTEIDTDLNILVMGDSVAIQMSHILQEAAQVAEKVMHKASWKMRDTGKQYDGLHSGVTSRRGLVAGWRILNFWKTEQEGGPLPNRPGGGWRRDDVTVLRNTAQTTNGRSDFDVFIFRPPQPWMKWDDFTETAVLETISLARNLLGVKLIIFLTVSYSNNVVTIEDIQQMHRVNDMIRSIGGHPNVTTANVTVLTLEAGQLIDLTVRHNARRLGLLTNVSAAADADDDANHFTLPRAKLLTESKWVGGSASYICGRPVEMVKNEPACIGNLLTEDGQHLCVKTMGGRLNAGLACLIECGRRNNSNSSNNHNDDASSLSLSQCQDTCNRVFMSLEPIPEALFVANTADSSDVGVVGGGNGCGDP